MSRQNSNAEADVYVTLLYISVAALVIGCIFLVMELQSYNWEIGG